MSMYSKSQDCCMVADDDDDDYYFSLCMYVRTYVHRVKVKCIFE